MKGWVYIAEQPATPGRLKIGRTNWLDPEDRLRELSKDTGAADNLSLCYAAVVENPSAVEAVAHETLKEQRVKGEWFEIGLEDAIHAIRSGGHEILEERSHHRRIEKHTETKKEKIRSSSKHGWGSKSALEQWIEEQSRRGKYARTDLRKLKHELKQDSGNPQLWVTANQEAEREGSDPEMVYRHHRLKELRQTRKAAGKKWGRYTIGFLLVSVIGIGLGSSVPPLGIVGAIAACCWPICGARWLYIKF